MVQARNLGFLSKELEAGIEVGIALTEGGSPLKHQISNAVKM